MMKCVDCKTTIKKVYGQYKCPRKNNIGQALPTCTKNSTHKKGGKK